MCANNSLLPLHNPLATSSCDHVLDDWLTLDGLFPGKLLPHVFPFFVAANVVADTIKSESMYTALLPIYLCRNLCNFLIKIVQVIGFENQINSLVDTFEKLWIRGHTLGLGLNFKLPESVFDVFDLLAFGVYEQLCPPFTIKKPVILQLALC